MFTRDSVIISHNIKTPLTSISRAVGNILQLTYGQLIKSLFSNNEQGFVYDPNDLSTMYQDAAGTVPVTGVGQPVGLMLDKSKGLALSAEKLTNRDFSNGSTGWNYTAGVWDFTNGFARKNPNIAGTDLTQGSAIVGKWYKVTYTISRYVSGNHYARCGGAVGAVKSGIGTFTSYVLATSTTGIGFGASIVADLDLVNISIKEIEGSHAQQTTSSMRPLLVASPQRLDFDTVDDNLITTLPAQLTGCTVVRAVPNVGTQILTGQTIPATYEDNKDHCGLIVINRALTPSETSAIAAEFNKRAGV